MPGFTSRRGSTALTSPSSTRLFLEEVLGSQNLPDGLDTHPSQKPEASQHHRKERENIFGMRKHGKINNMKKADTGKCIDNDQAHKVGKPGDLGKFLPGQGILTYTRRASVKMAKEKQSAPLIDLNMAPPECTDMEWTYDSNLQRLGSQPPAADLERVRSSGSSGTFFHGEPIKASDTDVGPSTFHLMGKDVCTTRGESSTQTPQKYTADVFSGDRLSYENRYGDFSNSQANLTQLLGCPPLPNHGSVALQNSPPLPTAPVFPITVQHGTPSSVLHADLPRQQVLHSTSSSVCRLNSVSYTLCHPGQAVQDVSNSTGDEALFSRNPENETGRAVPDNSSSGGDVQERS